MFHVHRLLLPLFASACLTFTFYYCLFHVYLLLLLASRLPSATGCFTFYPLLLLASRFTLCYYQLLLLPASSLPSATVCFKSFFSYCLLQVLSSTTACFTITLCFCLLHIYPLLLLSSGLPSATVCFTFDPLLLPAYFFTFYYCLLHVYFLLLPASHSPYVTACFTFTLSYCHLLFYLRYCLLCVLPTISAGFTFYLLLLPASRFAFCNCLLYVYFLLLTASHLPFVTV